MIHIDFDNNTIDDFTIILADRSLAHKGQIKNVNNFLYRGNLNSANESSFVVYKKMDDHTEALWDDIVDLKLFYVKELNEYFEMYVSSTESYNISKTITGTSLCEAELSQSLIRNLEVNSETDIDRDDYEPTVFYNEENPKASLLHRALSNMPHYSIKHVDESLKNLQRTFSVDEKNIYDFFIGDCAEQFNCLFQFDTTDRSISVYDLYTVCNTCGHREEYSDVCPKCGGTDLSYYGQDTTIFVSADNLTDEVKFETDASNIKNCFRLKAGDDYMTSAIISCNPNGSAYIYYFSEEQKKDMPVELVNKLESYDQLVSSYTAEYQKLSQDIYDCIDKILYYQSGMMPTVEIPEVNASTEAAKLTQTNLSPIGMTTVTKYTSVATVNSALKNFARVYVKTGFVKVEVDTGSFVYAGTDSNGHGYGDWTGRFKVTNYSDDADIAYSDTLIVRVTDDYDYYLNQKVLKNISNNDPDDGSVYDVLSITDLNKFKEALTYYCYSRLESFADAIQGVINVLIEENQAGIDSKYYNDMYTPYYNKLQACQVEMDIRSNTIEEYKNRQIALEKRKTEIQDALNFEKYLGTDLYKIFCAYRREDTYQNDNYISDGLTDDEVFKNALEFIETAKKEIVKSGEYQHSISANLYNLLIMKEFAPIKQYFELGNWIRCKVDDNVYRLRLISYEISGDNLKSLNTDFSDMTKTADCVSDVNNVIKSAQSMASSYSYVSKQASKGDEAQNTIKDFVNDGLNSAIVNIKNNDNEEVTFDNNGILARSYDDIIDDYSPKQLRITHNILAFTEDNWETTSLGLGEHDYYYYSDGLLKQATGYGLSSKFVTAGYINGSQIIGGEIFSQNYSSNSGTYLNLNDGRFSWAGGKIKYDGDNLILSGVNLTWSDIGDAPTKISQFENDANYQNAIQVTQITKDTVTAPYIKTLNLSVGNEILMGDNAVISWNNVTDQPIIPTNTSQLTNDSGYQNSEQVTTITKNTVTTSYVNALNITAGSVAAENITGKTIVGKDIVLGGVNNGDGSLIVKDANGSIICTIDVNGISLKSQKYLINDEITVIHGRFYDATYAPNLSEYYQGGGYSIGTGSSSTTGEGYLGVGGHTDNNTDGQIWGIDTGDMPVTDFGLMKILPKIYASGGNKPSLTMYLYGNGILLNTYGSDVICQDIDGVWQSLDSPWEYNISTYDTIRVKIEMTNESKTADVWFDVGIYSLKIS